MAEVLVHRLASEDPLGRKKPFDAVHVLNAFLDQCPALARDPPAVFLRRAWRDHHGADARLSPFEGPERAQECLAIDDVGLGAPMTPGHRNGGGLDDMTLDGVGCQQTMDPEAIQA